MKTIHFINGMPRSGSTLLCNILAQNPNFHSTPTSGLSELICEINKYWQSSPVAKASETQEKKLAIIKDLLQSYHSDTKRSIVFNKSRGWTPLIELIENALQKEIKIITTTRKITCILSSFEKIYRKELKLIDSPMQKTTNMETLEGRLGEWTAPNGIVGGCFNMIRDAVMRGHKHKFIFIDFDDLTHNPKQQIKNIYDFLNQPYFNHDFNNVEQYTTENDREHGFSSLHIIRKKIIPVEDDSKKILGDCWEQFSKFHYNF